jgi:hypothetical protein
VSVRGAAFILSAAFAQATPASATDAGSAESPARALAQGWAGMYDTLEQQLYDESGLPALTAARTARIRTLVTPVSVPWLGAEVLYLEEFAQDDPQSPRRQVLLWLSSAVSAGSQAVRVRQYTLREPARWRSMAQDHARVEALRQRDLEFMAGCDLLLTREGEQFRGGTLGRSCLAVAGDTASYVDYRLLVGGELYWYDRRVLRSGNDEPLAESVGFDWFELHEARLFACRVRASNPAQASEHAPLATLNLHDQGGHARFATPDGKQFELQLHSRDWPFDANRDALILIVRELTADAPALASSWTPYDAEQIGVELDALAIRCGAMAPNRTAMAF